MRVARLPLGTAGQYRSACTLRGVAMLIMEQMYMCDASDAREHACTHSEASLWLRSITQTHRNINSQLVCELKPEFKVNSQVSEALNFEEHEGRDKAGTKLGRSEDEVETNESKLRGSVVSFEEDMKPGRSEDDVGTKEKLPN